MVFLLDLFVFGVGVLCLSMRACVRVCVCVCVCVCVYERDLWVCMCWGGERVQTRGRNRALWLKFKSIPSLSSYPFKSI